MPHPVNIVCMKWGTLYGPDYVNKLYRGVARHLKRPFRFICYTDNAVDITEEVECLEFPDFPVSDTHTWSAFRKFQVFRKDVTFEGLTLFLDLDVVITGPLDEFFSHGETDQLVIIHNWIEWHKTIFRRRPDIGNSSVFRFPAKKFHFAWERFLAEQEIAFSRFPTEQAYLTYCLRDRLVYWPEKWVRSFKRHCIPPFPLNHFRPPSLPSGARIIAFHGRPHPDQAALGYRGKRPHHHTLACHWIDDNWSNHIESD